MLDSSNRREGISELIASVNPHLATLYWHLATNGWMKIDPQRKRFEKVTRFVCQDERQTTINLECGTFSVKRYAICKQNIGRTLVNKICCVNFKDYKEMFEAPTNANDLSNLEMEYTQSLENVSFARITYTKKDVVTVQGKIDVINFHKAIEYITIDILLDAKCSILHTHNVHLRSGNSKYVTYREDKTKLKPLNNECVLSQNTEKSVETSSTQRRCNVKIHYESPYSTIEWQPVTREIGKHLRRYRGRNASVESRITEISNNYHFYWRKRSRVKTFYKSTDFYVLLKWLGKHTRRKLTNTSIPSRNFHTYIDTAVKISNAKICTNAGDEIFLKLTNSNSDENETSSYNSYSSESFEKWSGEILNNGVKDGDNKSDEVENDDSKIYKQLSSFKGKTHRIDGDKKELQGSYLEPSIGHHFNTNQTYMILLENRNEKLRKSDFRYFGCEVDLPICRSEELFEERKKRFRKRSAYFRVRHKRFLKHLWSKSSRFVLSRKPNLFNNNIEYPNVDSHTFQKEEPLTTSENDGRMLKESVNCSLTLEEERSRDVVKGVTSNDISYRLNVKYKTTAKTTSGTPDCVFKNNKECFRPDTVVGKQHDNEVKSISRKFYLHKSNFNVGELYKRLVILKAIGQQTQTKISSNVTNISSILDKNRPLTVDNKTHLKENMSAKNHSSPKLVTFGGQYSSKYTQKNNMSNGSNNIGPSCLTNDHKDYKKGVSQIAKSNRTNIGTKSDVTLSSSTDTSKQSSRGHVTQSSITRMQSSSTQTSKSLVVRDKTPTLRQKRCNKEWSSCGDKTSIKDIVDKKRINSLTLGDYKATSTNTSCSNTCTVAGVSSSYVIRKSITKTNHCYEKKLLIKIPTDRSHRKNNNYHKTKKINSTKETSLSDITVTTESEIRNEREAYYDIPVIPKIPLGRNSWFHYGNQGRVIYKGVTLSTQQRSAVDLLTTHQSRYVFDKNERAIHYCTDMTEAYRRNESSNFNYNARPNYGCVYYVNLNQNANNSRYSVVRPFFETSTVFHDGKCIRMGQAESEVVRMGESSNKQSKFTPMVYSQPKTTVTRTYQAPVRSYVYQRIGTPVENNFYPEMCEYRDYHTYTRAGRNGVIYQNGPNPYITSGSNAQYGTTDGFIPTPAPFNRTYNTHGAYAGAGNKDNINLCEKCVRKAFGAATKNISISNVQVGETSVKPRCCNFMNLATSPIPSKLYGNATEPHFYSSPELKCSCPFTQDIYISRSERDLCSRCTPVYCIVSKSDTTMCQECSPPYCKGCLLRINVEKLTDKRTKLIDKINKYNQERNLVVSAMRPLPKSLSGNKKPPKRKNDKRASTISADSEDDPQKLTLMKKKDNHKQVKFCENCRTILNKPKLQTGSQQNRQNGSAFSWCNECQRASEMTFSPTVERMNQQLPHLTMYGQGPRKQRYKDQHDVITEHVYTKSECFCKSCGSNLSLQDGNVRAPKVQFQHGSNPVDNSGKNANVKEPKIQIYNPSADNSKNKGSQETIPQSSMNPVRPPEDSVNSTESADSSEHEKSGINQESPSQKINIEKDVYKEDKKGDDANDDMKMEENDSTSSFESGSYNVDKNDLSISSSSLEDKEDQNDLSPSTVAQCCSIRKNDKNANKGEVEDANKFEQLTKLDGEDIPAESAVKSKLPADYAEVGESTVEVIKKMTEAYKPSINVFFAASQNTTISENVPEDTIKEIASDETDSTSSHRDSLSTVCPASDITGHKLLYATEHQFTVKPGKDDDRMFATVPNRNVLEDPHVVVLDNDDDNADDDDKDKDCKNDGSKKAEDCVETRTDMQQDEQTVDIQIHKTEISKLRKKLNNSESDLVTYYGSSYSSDTTKYVEELSFDGEDS